MSEAAIFSVGAVMFIATTWATLSFGLRRMYELQRRDLEASERIGEIRKQGLTEIHVSVPLPEEEEAPGSRSR